MPEWDPSLRAALAAERQASALRPQVAGARAAAVALRDQLPIDHARTTDDEDPVVVCACRRRVASSMMRDMRGYAPAESPTPHPFICDSCFAALEREGRTTALAHAERHGAPPELLAKLAAKAGVTAPA